MPAAVLAVPLALALAVLGGCARGTDAPDSAAPAPAASIRRLDLPQVSPGDPVEGVSRLLAGWQAPHRFTGDGVSPEGWEWTGPDGMRLEAYVARSRIVASRVSRTWGSGAPPVEGRDLPGLEDESTLERLVARVGPGLLVERTVAPETGSASGSQRLDRYRWAIHDRGLDTGLFLTVDVRDGVVASVRHRWSGR